MKIWLYLQCIKEVCYFSFEKEYSAYDCSTLEFSVLHLWLITYSVSHFTIFPDPDIRYCVLASLDERFDAHLAQAENLQALFVALNDEVFEIRELAICTIGRLSSMNPAFVMPFLRKMLIQVANLVLNKPYFV